MGFIKSKKYLNVLLLLISFSELKIREYTRKAFPSIAGIFSLKDMEAMAAAVYFQIPLSFIIS